MDIELWKDVAGYDGDYQVSNLGRVKSLKRGPEHPRVLRPNTNSRGYRYVVLCRDGCTKTMQVHRLVATTFIENPDGLPQVNHKDTNKQNNRVGNLEWLTGLENTRHAAAHGLLAQKLTPEKVLEIHAMASKGLTQYEIADSIGISQRVVSGVLSKKYWKHVPRPANDNHPYGDGTYKKGEDHRLAKLSEAQVLEIVAALGAGVSCSILGGIYGVHKSTIAAIRDGRSWKHLHAA